MVTINADADEFVNLPGARHPSSTMVVVYPEFAQSVPVSRDPSMDCSLNS